MRFSRTLSLYLVREVTQYSLLGFLVFSAVLLSQNLLRRMAELTAAAPTAGEVVALVACLTPMLTAYVLPVSLLFGVLLAVGRMCSDAEVTALRSCGLGLGALVGPLLALALLISALTGYIMIHVEPTARQELRAVLKSVLARVAVVEEGRFRSLGSRVVFVRERDDHDRLRGIVVWDRSRRDRPFAVFAKSGQLVFDEETFDLLLHLEDGDVHVEPSDGDSGRYRRIAFRTLDYRFNVSSVIAAEAGRLKPRDMTLPELRAVLARAGAGDPLEDLRERDPRMYELQIHRRFALPAAPILFALVGVPLGLRRTRGARSWGAMVCIALAFTYYAILSVGEFLAESSVPPAAALWLPNAVFAALAAFLLWRARHAEA